VLQHKPEGNPYYGMILGQRSVAAIIKNDPTIDVVPAGKIFNFCLRILLKRYQRYIQLHKLEEAEIFGHSFRSDLPSGDDRGLPLECVRT